MYQTECDFCRIVSTRQPAGDGCHSCSNGTMKSVAENMSVYATKLKKILQGVTNERN